VEDDRGVPHRLADRRDVADVGLDELVSPVHAVQVLAPPGREVVEDANGVPELDQALDDVRADEPGAARYQHD
jgi:hypothetical protein